MPKDNDIFPKAGDLVPVPAPAFNTQSLIEQALAKGVDGAQLEKFMDLHERHLKLLARQEFNDAFNAFKAAAPAVIKRTGQVGYDGRGGGSRTEYAHTELDYAVSKLVPLLAQHSLSHRWETKQEGGMVTVTCFIEHRSGHMIQTTLSGPPDNSGSKNPIQAIGSAVTYLERYTFLALTGMAATGQDDDAGGAGTSATLDADEVNEIEALFQQGGGERALFIKYLCDISRAEITGPAELRRRHFEPVKEMLVKKIEANSKKKAGGR